MNEQSLKYPRNSSFHGNNSIFVCRLRLVDEGWVLSIPEVIEKFTKNVNFLKNMRETRQ